MRIVGWKIWLSATKFFGMMVARDGVEPPTPAFSGLRSAILKPLTFAGISETEGTINGAWKWHQKNTKPHQLTLAPAFAKLGCSITLPAGKKKHETDCCEDCEIVKATETSSYAAFGFQFATVPTREKVGVYAYSALVVVAKSSSSIGHLTYNRLPVEPAITLVTLASKTTTRDSIDS